MGENTSTTHGGEGTKRWGVLPDYHRRGVAPAQHPLPPLLQQLAERMRRVGVLKGFVPNEANAIDYRRSRGSWLKPHADDRILSGEVIVTLCLLGSAVMTFGRQGAAGAREGERQVLVPLAPRTLQQLYVFLHAPPIQPPQLARSLVTPSPRHPPPSSASPPERMPLCCALSSWPS
ncbi:putative alpha-ketoglutarate-dependent dioxygenase ABH4 [Tetrabaena socialis]|uniref:Putative alpha-ketoglutarate-dependent dioxygenase ABH4 n=1 Tax=Tetrabaena socialis TaxID=47790 RepID=A0A2J7ZHY4_9CHLO|nr:putative alpha-ketoglutarate-dependent dioxygenase ABH4 [Tetrabaena socialis]|eukprot:PNG99883.1 putative alpha-ketoglutarate-dependent dioxygenase ABH4 [Tetrabaena socialis]